MQTIIWTLQVLMALAMPPQQAAPQPAAPHQHPPSTGQEAPLDKREWQIMVPELGAASPQVSILRVDPKTQATQLLIRIPKKMHVPTHWHSANETHTVIKGTFIFEHEGQRHELGPGGFNYLPARMHHQAWASDDALVFITVDSAWDVNWVQAPPSQSDLGQWPSGH